MALATYSDLQSALTDWFADTGFTSRVADMIALAEAEANRRVRIRQNMNTVSLTLLSGQSSTGIPSSVLEDIELNYADTAERIIRSTFDDIDFVNTTDSETGRPSKYAITESTVQFDQKADKDYTLLLRYYKKWDIASDGQNWLLTNAPDVYLFGSLAEAAAYQMDEAREAKWMARRNSAIDETLRSDSRTKGGQLVVDAALMASPWSKW